MPVYKVLIIGTKVEKVTHQPTGYTSDVEHTAFSPYYYFTTLEKAKNFCEQYIRPVIEYEDTDEPPEFIVKWDDSMGDMWSVTSGIYNFNIYTEEFGELDTLSRPPLPNKFAVLRHCGD